RLQGFFRSLCLLFVARRLDRSFLGLRLRSPELDKLGVLFEKPDVDTVGSMVQDVPASVGKLKLAPARGRQKSSLMEIALGPGDPVGKLGLPAAREHFLAFSARKLELGSQHLSGLNERVFLAVGCHPQERQHQRLKVGNCHALSPLRWLTNSRQTSLILFAPRPSPPIYKPLLIARTCQARHSMDFFDLRSQHGTCVRRRARPASSPAPQPAGSCGATSMSTPRAAA